MALEVAKEQLRIGKIDEPRYKEIEEQMFPKPKITKADGGIVNLSNGGDALLGQMVEKLKNKPKLGSSTQTMGSVIDALNTADDTIVERDTSRIKNIVSGSDVKRQMGPDIFEVFEKGGIKTAQINAIKNVPDINDYLDDFDGYNKAMKKYRNTALKGLTDNQIKLVKSSGFLTEYAEQMRKDILSKGVTKKGNKLIVNPKYKNVITIGKNGIPKISKAFENKYLAKNFDFVFETKGSATGVDKPKTQSKIYTQIRETAKNTLNKAQQLNLDFALSQIDKLFKTNPTKAKAALAAVASLVSKGAFGATTGGIGFAMDLPMLIEAGKNVKDVALPFVEEEVIEPAAQKMVQGENMLMNLLMNRMN
jgi:hypothetical protein